MRLFIKLSISRLLKTILYHHVPPLTRSLDSRPHETPPGEHTSALQKPSDLKLTQLPNELLHSILSQLDHATSFSILTTCRTLIDPMAKIIKPKLRAIGIYEDQIKLTAPDTLIKELNDFNKDLQTSILEKSIIF